MGTAAGREREGVSMLRDKKKNAIKPVKSCRKVLELVQIHPESIEPSESFQRPEKMRNSRDWTVAVVTVCLVQVQGCRCSPFSTRARHGPGGHCMGPPEHLCDAFKCSFQAFSHQNPFELRPAAFDGVAQPKPRSSVLCDANLTLAQNWHLGS